MPPMFPNDATEEDRYRGVTIDSSKFGTEEVITTEKFELILHKAEESWGTDGKRGIWFKIDNAHAEFIPILVKAGYDFHHARPGFAMLKKWLPKDEIDLIPEYPYTFVGVGGLLIKDNKVLMVKERYAISSKWKLPGGYVEKGENLGIAASREVKEETGIDAKPLGLVTLRHTHPHPELSFPCKSIKTGNYI